MFFFSVSLPTTVFLVNLLDGQKALRLVWVRQLAVGVGPDLHAQRDQQVGHHLDVLGPAVDAPYRSEKEGARKK